MLIGGGMLFASFLLPVAGGLVSAGTLLGTAVFALCIYPKDKRLAPRIAVTFIILLLAAVRFLTLDLYISDKTARLAECDAEIEAIVYDIESQKNTSRFYLDIISSTEEEAEGISAVGYMFEAVTFSSGDKIRAEVTFKENDDRYKYSDFDSGKYISVKVKNYVIAERSASFLHSFADKTRKGILSAANSLGPDEAAKLLGAVLIGNKRSITVDLSDDVRATGTSHMLVVSGLHLGILCGLVMRLLKTRTNRRLTVLIMSLFVLFVSIICLFHISVLRAGLTYIIMLIGMLIFKDNDSVNSLGMATTILVFFFPFLFYNTAFMLSAAATFAVIGPASSILDTFRFGHKGSPLYLRAIRHIFEVFTVALCALILTLPITVYYFGSTSLIAPLSNLLLGFSVTGMLAAGMLGALLWFLPLVGKLISIPFIFVAKLFAGYFLLTVKLIAESGIGFVNISHDKSVLCGIFAVVFSLTVYYICKKVNSKKEIKPRVYRKDPEILP